jgi:alkylation response protein AidB-like acyl-CoA dehydrogenase
MRRTGRAPGAEVSMLKIRGTEIHQAITELFVQAAGPGAQPREPLEGRFEGPEAFAAAVAPRFLNMRKMTIYGGSNEIQRNILSKAMLGL